MKLLAWSMTDTGRKRERNEDSLLVSDGIALFAVADGMGGHQGGARASALALEVLERELEKEPTDSVERDMTDAARTASAAIFEEALLTPELRGMGTTLTAILFREGKMHVCHAGDSRGYLFRDGALHQITDDHSWTEEQVRAGIMTREEAEASQFRHVITRSVGFERSVEVDTLGMTVEFGDCFLLCSDGLSNLVNDEEVSEALAKRWYSQVPPTLVDLANERGGDDNITVVVVYVANDDG